MTKSTEIKPINHETVHRICSGQVVLSLAIAVKEIVENAIDAGAKNIEIRLKNYGQDAIEIIDNGTGVQEENFRALTLKHYTSKIREFNDLENIATLGFRGEALSSLCALADLTIITRHGSAEHGTKLQYDHNGDIKIKSICARSVGTTVQLSNLFSTLPVRRKEFTKNSKKEFNKMCSLLYAYCLVCTDVKFTCSNQVLNNKNLILSTQAQGSVTDNIINIFGKKQTPNLFEVALVQPDENIAGDYGIKKIPDVSPFQFDFHISSVVHGSGRSASDRQFYYINSRPCESCKIAKLVNDTYKLFNSQQFPFVYLNIKVLSSLVDVNVTPDKRQIFLEQEKLLMATVKMSLMEAFKTFPSTYKVQNFDISQQQLHEQKDDNKRKYEQVEERGSFKTFLENFKKKPKIDVDNKSTDKLDRTIIDEKIICSVTPKRIQKSLTEFKIVRNPQEIKYEGETPVSPQTSSIDSETNQLNDLSMQYEEQTAPNNNKDKINESPPATSQISCMSSPTISKSAKPPPKLVFDSPCTSKPSSTNSIPLNFTIDSIKQAVEESQQTNARKRDLVVKFRCEIAPQSNKDAEKELSKQFSKDMFKQMDIIGQFNYGFIIASLDQDLFIIDQHATDEIYNFEMLQRNTVMESQLLVKPKPLQLTSVDEAVLLENEALFNKNGFHFEHNLEAPVTERTKLTKIPMSKSTIFGKDDIDEMIHMLKEGADTNCRPSRIRGMFASRACRKSVMIGKALSKSAMKTLVDHMADIDQPWNCPHGRPTMRHLINLNLLE